MNDNSTKGINILLIEDNTADAQLTMEAFKENRTFNTFHIVKDGVEGMAFLHREGKYANVPRPDLILLDLNLPKKNGFSVLAEVKADVNLKRIPVVVLTTSTAEEDINKSYALSANCVISKPVDLKELFQIVKSIKNFWLSTVKLPSE